MLYVHNLDNLLYIANCLSWEFFTVANLNWKTFAVGGSLVWPKPIAQAILPEKFCSYTDQSLKTVKLPPRMICNIRYAVSYVCNLSHLLNLSQRFLVMNVRWSLVYVAT